MNERIKELAEQAIAKYWPNGSADHEKIFENFGKFMEIHAELIIQECIAQVKLELGNRQLLLSNPPQNAGVWDACNNIRRHFGVEK